MVMITGYFIIDPDKVLPGNHVDVESDKAFNTADILTLEPDIKLGKLKTKDSSDKDKEKDFDSVPVFDFPGVECAALDNGKKIVKVVFTEFNRKQCRKFAKAESEDMSDTWLTDIGIKAKFVGWTLGDVLTKYPELIGQKVVGQDAEGKDILVDKIQVTTFCGE